MVFSLLFSSVDYGLISQTVLSVFEMCSQIGNLIMLKIIRTINQVNGTRQFFVTNRTFLRLCVV
jgi:hypothetical protein